MSHLNDSYTKSSEQIKLKAAAGTLLRMKINLKS